MDRQPLLQYKTSEEQVKYEFISKINDNCLVFINMDAPIIKPNVLYSSFHNHLVRMFLKNKTFSEQEYVTRNIWNYYIRKPGRYKLPRDFPFYTYNPSIEEYLDYICEQDEYMNKLYPKSSRIQPKRVKWCCFI